MEKEIKLINESITLKITRKEFENIYNDLFVKILNSINPKNKYQKRWNKRLNFIWVTTKIPIIKEIIKSCNSCSKI